MARMAERLDSTIDRLTAEDFLAAAQDPTIRSAWQPEGVTSLEGPPLPRHVPGVERRERGPGDRADDRADGAGRQPGGHRQRRGGAGAHAVRDPDHRLDDRARGGRGGGPGEDRPRHLQPPVHRHAARHRRVGVLRRHPGGARHEPAVLRAAHGRRAVEHIPAHRSAADADRQPGPGVDPGGPEPGSQPGSRRPDLRRSARTPISASTTTTCSVPRTAATCSPPRASSTTPTSRPPSRLDSFEFARCADRLAGRPQPVADDPSGGVRGSRRRLVVRRVRRRTG